jgi:hypothetical protein
MTLDPDEFVEFLAGRWPRLCDSLFATIPTAEAAELRQLERDHGDNILADVLHLCKNCHEKRGFADAYREMKRHCMYLAREWPGHASRSAQNNAVARQIMVTGVNFGLNILAIWFDNMLGEQSQAAKVATGNSAETIKGMHFQIDSYGV